MKLYTGMRTGICMIFNFHIQLENYLLFYYRSVILIIKLYATYLLSGLFLLFVAIVTETHFSFNVYIP